MKTIRIVLMLLIVLGLGLLTTQQYWLPKLVNQILEWQGVATGPIVEMPTETTTSPNTATSSSEFMSDWNWVTATATESGVQFKYPNPLPTTYVSTVDWPPQVTVRAGVLDCSKGVESVNGSAKKLTIHNREYCVTVQSEGAAGSTFTTYTYETVQGDFVASANFTFRTPQCLNYDEPQQSTCTLEQSEFDVDAFADRMFESVTMP